MSIASINRQLEVLRRLLKLATDWGKVERTLPKVEMLPGENHRDRVLSADDEASYLEATVSIGRVIEADYQRALNGIRARTPGRGPRHAYRPVFTTRRHGIADGLRIATGRMFSPSMG